MRKYCFMFKLISNVNFRLIFLNETFHSHSQYSFHWFSIVKNVGMQTESEPSESTGVPRSGNSANQLHTFASEDVMLIDSSDDEKKPKIYSELSKFDISLPNICPKTDSNDESIKEGCCKVHSRHFLRNRINFYV